VRIVIAPFHDVKDMTDFVLLFQQNSLITFIFYSIIRDILLLFDCKSKKKMLNMQFYRI